jgi:LmbE family N-acetylglucosaminyl deacetylase
MTGPAILAALTSGVPLSGRHVVVTAHPDDETVSFGGALSLLADVVLVQLTTGADDQQTSALRAAERAAALQVGGWRLVVRDGGAPGREAHHHLPHLASLLSEVVADADVVWTHPYEAGHLDHDTAAWLVQRVCARGAAVRMEFASYHCNATTQTFGAFWPDPTVPSGTAELQGDALARKQAALAAYLSQAAILRKFPAIEREAYRVAPRYDFAAPAPPPRCRWDIKGYRPSTHDWRRTIAAQEAA